MTIDSSELAHIASIAATAAAKATVETWEARRAKANERIYTIKAIAIEVGLSERQVRDLVSRGKFPLDRDPRGYSVRRWELERWIEARRVAVDTLRGRILRGEAKNPA